MFIEHHFFIASFLNLVFLLFNKLFVDIFYDVIKVININLKTRVLYEEYKSHDGMMRGAEV